MTSPAPQSAGTRAAQSSAPPDADAVVVLDFGSQFSMLIARRIRECGVYCELLPWNAPREQAERLHPRGYVLSGGPNSVYDADAPTIPQYVLEAGVPLLGICYGMQALAHQLGGEVAPGSAREYGAAAFHRTADDSPLFAGLVADLPVWMSHGDHVLRMPPGFRAVGASANSPIAAMEDEARGFVAIQFHPEVAHTPQGIEIVRNFLLRICRCDPTWDAGSFVVQAVERLRAQIGDGRVICGLSGGVDSAVAAALIHRAVGDQLTCIFVDNGLLRAGEAEQVVETFQRHLHIPLVHVAAEDRFLARLAGVTDPEQKRKIIGNEFIYLFEDEAAKLGEVEFIAQGTTYPDVVESAATGAGATAKIKTHHNVGGLPSEMRLELVEPLRFLFKDEVRRVGLELGLPAEMVYRHPFPGPGLAIRIMGEVTKSRLDVLRAADKIVLDEVRAAGEYDNLWQAFAVLTDTRTVGVQGDFRTYGHAVAIRAVTADDAMTADWAKLPYDLLARISSRITNEVRAINRVVYDITSKPPGTIEWE
jgi:GMP synthase (glutamine-hydrolysing)